MEEGFLKYRRPLLVSRLKLLNGLVLVASGASLMAHLLTPEGFEGSKVEVGEKSSEVFLTCQLAIMAVQALFVAILCIKEGTPVFRSHVLLESTAVVIAMLSMTALVFSEPKRFVKLQGYALQEVFKQPYHSDSTMLMVIDGWVTAFHIGLPLRWHIMVPLEIGAVLLYVLHLALIGSEEPLGQVMQNCILLASLVFCAAFNKRWAERQQRKCFLSVIKEKSLRCKAEFQLSQVFVPKESRSDEKSAETRSEPLTEKSGAIFDAVFSGSQGSAALELVAAKGESEHWRIAASEVKLLEEVLGEGSFGSVRRAVFCGMPVAVKCPHLEPGDMKVPELCNELRVLRHLRHPHIVAVYGAVVLPQRQQIHLVLELIKGVSLKAFIMDPESKPSVAARYEAMLGVCEALLYMHTRMPPVVHGDLKGSNVMIEFAGDRALPKLLDFGLSRAITPHSRALGGSLAWMAPEVIDHAPVRCSADLFSLGRLLAFVSTGTPPMHGMTSNGVIKALRTAPKEPAWPQDCPFLDLEPVVQRCLQKQQERRPCAAEVHETLLGLSGSLLTHDNASLQRAKLVLEAGSSRSSSRADGSLRVRESLSSLPEEEEAAPQEATARKTRCWPYPELPMTSQAAMELSLLATFRRWNTAQLSTACCEGHAWCRLGQVLIADMLCAPCTPAPLHVDGPPEKAAQCESCGILGVPGACCELCGWQPELRLGSASL